MSAPPLINSLEFARDKQRLEGQLPVARMARLQDQLTDAQGELRYVVQGGVNELGVPKLVLSLEGSCWLRCQRCLSALEYPVTLQSTVLLRTEAELDALEDDDEDFDSILAEASLDILNLLEEELLLSLPISPRHSSCQMETSQALAKDSTHPFAALEKLKHP